MSPYKFEHFIKAYPDKKKRTFLSIGSNYSNKKQIHLPIILLVLNYNLIQDSINTCKYKFHPGIGVSNTRSWSTSYDFIEKKK